MSNFIEELYYGNIDPQARSTKQNKTVSKQMEILMANETFLTETLTDECKKKFLDYVDAWGWSTANPTLIVLSQDSAWAQTLHTILLYQPKPRLRI